jgi:predicted CoA-binding protein
MSKKTVIIGATTNTERYAYAAASRLLEAGHEIVPLGIKRGEVIGRQILDITSKPVVSDVDTVTMYVGPQHQENLQEYIQTLHPKRVIFNPGTENSVLEKALQDSGIEVVEGCTLVMLATNQY